MTLLSRKSVIKWFQDGNHFNDKNLLWFKVKRIISLDSYISTFIEYILIVCRYLVLCLHGQYRPQWTGYGDIQHPKDRQKMCMGFVGVKWRDLIGQNFSLSYHILAIGLDHLYHIIQYHTVSSYSIIGKGSMNLACIVIDIYI